MIHTRIVTIFILCLCISFLSMANPQEAILWEPVEWSFAATGHSGNAFDVEAKAVFTHQQSGEVITTGLYYDGGDTWKLRFTGTREGNWHFVTTSDHTPLHGLKGSVKINKNADPQAHGFIKNFGSKWGWQGTEQAFVPQYVMGKDLDYFYDFENDRVDEQKIDADIKEFVHEHGFTGFHMELKYYWFDIKGKEAGENPDRKAYQTLEAILQKVHDAGGACHLWMWGADGRNDDKGGPGGVIGGHMNDIDKRNLAYLAARLGPLPGWSMGYGFDTENGWATQEQLYTWKNYVEDRMGWDHFLGARVGYDDKGQWALENPPPKPPLDAQNNAPIGDEYVSWLGGDYTGYTSYRPMYERYRQAITHQPQEPSFEEDRFRLRNRPNWVYKDYNQERTRRGLWNSAMAGGVANIWGNQLPESLHGGSQPYDVDTIRMKHEVKTYSEFFKNRFLKEMSVSEQGPVKILAVSDGTKAVLYQEGTGSIQVNLKNAPERIHAVAVDTKKPYREIDLGKIKTSGFTWQAPHTSDWAIAIGDFK